MKNLPLHAETGSGDTSEWQLHAYLNQTISSANEKPGNTFEAVVAEPDAQLDDSLAVPEGSNLSRPLRAKPARFFGEPESCASTFVSFGYARAHLKHVFFDQHA